jgi:hypothetical protein
MAAFSTVALIQAWRILQGNLLRNAGTARFPRMRVQGAESSYLLQIASLDFQTTVNQIT